MIIKRQSLANTLLLMSALATLPGCNGATQTPSSSRALASSQASSSSTSSVKGDIDAAPVAIRRLSKDEYNNTVRDLFGTDVRPADDYPFDNYSAFEASRGVPAVSPTHVARYHSSAAALAKLAILSAKEGNRNVISCDLEQSGCAQTVIDDFGLKAWRRPITTEESEQLISFYDNVLAISLDHAAAMQLLIQRIILSPNFIFRPEFDQDLTSGKPVELNSYELASRLSYFLWGSMPDAELFERAADDTLRDEQILSAEVARMLDSPKAQNLVSVFAAQWLGFEGKTKLSDLSLTGVGSNELHIDSAKLESITFASYIIQNNLPVSEIVSADYSFINNVLAFYYEQGYQLRPLNDDDLTLYMHTWGSESQRRGILGQYSFLNKFTTISARGLWVMQRLQCENPDRFFVYTPPFGAHPVIHTTPPAEVIENPRKEAEFYQNESLLCSSCHTQFDSIGFALGNFIENGTWRENYYGGAVIDSTGALPEGTFNGPVELANVLTKGPDLALCAIQYAMTYALGRELDTFHYSRADFFDAIDAASVYSVYENTKENGHRMQDIFTEIVMSPAFRYRRGADSSLESQQ